MEEPEIPADYLKCREALLREGKSLKEAQRICSINYYKKHGKALPHDSKSGLDADQIPTNADEHPMDTADAAIVLDYLYTELKKSGKLDSISIDDFAKYVRIK